ncbi:CapA family protein [Paenibacillus alvei]|uniref:CapA family protein n=1 Tax=Paenibacillus alvei TaxID=44250 RepID=A0AAP6ZZ45_PAEAL|nr:CapA family protein [Paenibacillus alvei]MBG9736385.1 capsule biosynthesis protein [Paenibacillus alvei]MBG9742872.1 capsule biosynthesis protein [Paenibacillus alvei]MCY9577857.1 CapA family protein [Paenibacillus alvei]MCY9586981.1 CapA family protein [Paenibacillus alvei]NEZ42761.1 CapA family protein [Paenibacillus alvei]
MELSRTERHKQRREQQQQRKRKAVWIYVVFGIIVISAALFAWQGKLFDLGGTEAKDGITAPAGDKSAVGDQEQNGEGANDSKGTKDVTDANDGTTVPENKKEATVRLTFVGDMMMSGRVEDVVKDKGYDFPYYYAKSLLQDADLAIGNLETPLTTGGKPADNKLFVYKSSPKMAQVMADAGIDIVNLANNHSMDQGEEGLLDTFQALKAANVSYIGAGKNSKEAYTPLIVERNGIKLAFLGLSRVIPDDSWYAWKNKPGVATTYEGTKERAAESIKAAKKEADIVVVIAHWGEERTDEPNAKQKELAKLFVDSGADLIVGGHPHVVQGFEQQQDSWIAYSMGNFIFTQAENPKTWETMALQAECKKDGKCELKMTPYFTDVGQAIPLEGERGQKVMKRLQEISTGIHIDQNGNIRKKQ